MIATPVPGALQQRDPVPGSLEGWPWCRPELLRRVHQALQMADRALTAAVAQGEACAGESTTTDEPNSVRPLILAKVMAEAAMLMRCATFLCDEDATLANAMNQLARRLAPHVRGEPVAAQLCREPARAIEHAAAHVYLTDIGHGDCAFDCFLLNIQDGEPMGGPERLPNHALECHWLEQIRSGAVATDAIDADALGRTCVALPLDVLGCSTLDLYAFTHVVLYASDMGRRQALWPRQVHDMAAEAEAALAAALDADNFDLAAELLWTWPMLGLAWSAVALFSFQVLASAQDAHGFLPGPQYMQESVDAQREFQREDFILRTSYHATFVMGILCAAALRPGASPSAWASYTNPDAGCADRLLQLMPPSARAPHWLACLAQLEPSRRATLAPFVLNVHFRRSTAGHDMLRLRSGLEAALACGLANGPAVQQALALLRRATSLARRHHQEASGLPVA